VSDHLGTRRELNTVGGTRRMPTICMILSAILADFDYCVHAAPYDLNLDSTVAPCLTIMASHFPHPKLMYDVYKNPHLYCLLSTTPNCSGFSLRAWDGQLISLLSLTANRCRPSIFFWQGTDRLCTNSDTVTLSLSKKRLSPTCSARFILI